MKIALVCLARPETGTGNGTTEYSYQLYTRLKARGNKVDLFYGMKKSVRYDVSGYPKMWFFLQGEIKKLAKMDYDIIHITMQELGFSARILKENGSKAKVITTIHDLARLDDSLHKGIFHRSFGLVVKRSIRDAFEYSDFILFNSAQTQRDASAKFGAISNSKVVWHGTRKIFFSPASRKKSSSLFSVGYIGALATHKNVISILKVAKLLKQDRKFRFLVYGTGIEYKRIERFKNENDLNNVNLGGFVAESRIVQVYDSLNAFMMPSMYEGLSHQLLEAMTRGIPCIVFKNARIPSEITEYCFRAKDYVDAARIIRLLASRGYEKARMRRALGFARKFTWDRTAVETLKVYRKLL